MRIGIDFDNTLVSYEQAFAQVGREEGLLPEGFRGGKEAVKASLLEQRPDGYLWEKLQGLVYGRRIGAAELFNGVDEFFRRCRERRDVTVKVVSHKTILAHHDPGSDLRHCALNWMHGRRFFEPTGFGLTMEDVFFEGTRDEKVRRIAALGCDVFVDDHPEVLGHTEMPKGCRKILFRSNADGPFDRAASWQDVSDAIFSHP